MPGIFKRLSANDIKITPFEAHKQYNTVNLDSIGAKTSSVAWSGENKSNFDSGSREYYQLDKLYYRNYISERAHRLELDDATYTTQERRLYQSASVLSLSQKTFGSEVQPESFELDITHGGRTYNIKDDGFGNLYNTAIGKNNFPNEDNRVFYLAPVNGFKRSDLTLDISNGNTFVSNSANPYLEGYSEVVYDDSYFQNTVIYKGIKFHEQTAGTFQGAGSLFTKLRYDSDADKSRITVENRSYLNFNDDDFCISFQYIASSATNTLMGNLSDGELAGYILTKEGAQTSSPLGTIAGGDFSTRTSGALDLTTVPANPAFPYSVYVKRRNSQNLDVFLERFDGENRAIVSGTFFNSNDGVGLKHILLQKTGSKLQAYFTGSLGGEVDDTTTKPCQNKADVLIFEKRNSDGSYYDGRDDWCTAFQPLQFQIWNQSMSSTQISLVSESFTGTYPIGNIFYDNGFAVLTHPRYMDLFNGGTLNTLKYKNTHLITENEYQCTMTEDEFEFTTNPTARKTLSVDGEELLDFTTGSNFKPYVTSIGLHDDDGNLLVIGKLAQPVKASDETDTTFVIRFDT